ncbi:uncharacterized protein CTHT_0018090 [Thermochaetoides thermophila DSM 1495]|uniref:Endonuclease/exonuclease/phosphatase domain-containing protein n=1 Tax=Chaetomium thermophilum (strain DSM 1495 / CBS 144.50 / IMI 039719) TaxID=759272 RepID=G0S2Q5_CHATD|nr:hypothetical protein CTHT_0018090 [Thermochaetoides thermophila DSM 1495]EGS22288.1 hypothetical protein CTHT_0018090 [Thermochaetoides thermophila DSM 1495]
MFAGAVNLSWRIPNTTTFEDPPQDGPSSAGILAALRKAPEERTTPSNQAMIRTYAQALTSGAPTPGAPLGPHTARYETATEGPSRRAFLRVDRSHPTWKDVTPSGIVNLLVERPGFPRRDIIKVYLVNSGFAIEVSRPELRNTLAAKGKEHGLRIYSEVPTYAYFRIFDSDPSVPLKRKVHIYTCDRCLGFSHKDKCRSAAYCNDCLSPAKPGHQDCPARPRVWQGEVMKLTETQRKAVKEEGQAAYKAARRASPTPNAPNPEPTPSQGNPTSAEEDLPDAPQGLLTRSAEPLRADRDEGDRVELRTALSVVQTPKPCPDQSQPMPRGCKIISANVQRSLANIDGVLQRAVRHCYQVVCIQEPPILFGRVRRHPGFTLYAVDNGAIRAAIYVGRRLSASAPTAPEHGLLSVSLQGITIVNVYLHSNLGNATNTWRSLRPLQPGPGSFVVVGDFNTHHPDWGPQGSDKP